jgi:hypothetical protein
MRGATTYHALTPLLTCNLFVAQPYGSQPPTCEHHALIRRLHIFFRLHPCPLLPAGLSSAQLPFSNTERYTGERETASPRPYHACPVASVGNPAKCERLTPSSQHHPKTNLSKFLGTLLKEGVINKLSMRACGNQIPAY